MSFIVKEIDLPKGIDGLSITFHSQDGVMETHILDATQIVQLPKGHGRLIDASTKTTVKSMSGEAMDVGMLLIALKQYVPTIIEAEE